MSWAAVVIAAAAPAMALVGVPRVPLMWPFYRLGVVLPGCGLTRGVVALAAGDPVGAWRWNPAAFLVAALVPVAIIRFVVGVRTGRWLDVEVHLRWWLVTGAVAAIGALWMHQWANAAALMGR